MNEIIKEFRLRRAKLIGRSRELFDKANSEKRDMTSNENSKWNKNLEEIKSMDAEIYKLESEANAHLGNLELSTRKRQQVIGELRMIFDTPENEGRYFNEGENELFSKKIEELYWLNLELDSPRIGSGSGGCLGD